MSATDPAADPVQPQEGQGEVGTSDAPYAEHLSRIPEEFRDQVEPVFRDWDGQVTKRFQDYSNQAKEWEPYSDVKQYDPEAVQNALAFYQAASNDPQAIKAWYEGQYAPAHGLVSQPQPEQPQPDQFGQGFETFDQGQQMADLLKQQLSPLQQQLEQLSSWRQQQEEQAQLQAGQAMIDQQIAELRKSPEFTDEAVDWVKSRAETAYINDPNNAINRAWGDLQTFINAVEKQTLQKKVDAPKPAEAGGPPDVSPERLTNFKQAEGAALEFLKNSRG